MQQPIRALLFCLICLSGTVTMIAASTDGLPGDLGFSRVDSPLEISSTGPERTAIALHDSPVAIRDTFVDFRAYQVFTLPGEPFLCREGAPAIPHVTRLYHIPNTGSVVPEIRTLEWETVTDVYPLPLQVEKADLNRRREEDPSIYHTDAWYPEQPIFVGPPMVFRDFRVVAVTICPVQVNPMTRQARICRNVEVDLVATDEPGENELMSTRRPSRVFAPLYRSLISNLDESALDEVTDTPGTYLILCKGDTTSQQYADSMATWRRRVGYDVTIDSRSNWTYNSMRSAIVAANNSADPPLEFVCILGDPNSAVGLPTHSSEYDHYFADLTGDHLEDVAVGRLPASSGSQFRLIFAKITAYEREPYMDNPSWFTRAFLYAGEGYDITSNHVTMLWCGRQFVNHTGISDVRISTHGSNQVNNTLIANRLNEGVTYFLWRGTVVNEMSSSAPNGTNNGSKLPVSLTITCGTGDFNSTSGPCLSESWVLAGTPGALKGAVCGIGTATTSTWVHYNNTVAGGLVYNICNLGVEHIGTALAGAKAQLFEAFPYDGNATNFVRWNNLMGDPALALWTQPPVVMNVTHPGTVNVGARRIRPQVTNAQTGQPIRDALVVLWKGDETYERVLTDEFGFADVPVRVDTEGTLTLTVSKRNHKPYLANISCVNATEMATLSSYLLDDDNLNGSSGNGDGILNPGETIDLSTYIGNFGQTDTARQLSGVLTTTLPRVTVVTGTAVFPDIAPGDSALGNSPFRFLSAPTIRNNERVFLTIALTSAARTTHSTLRLICAAGEAVFSNYQVQGGDGDSYLEPGETTNLRVTIQNVGDLTLGNATGVLHSRTSYVSVLGTTATFGTIPPGGSGTSAGTGFLVAANPLSYPGFPAEMLLVLTSDNGHVDSVVFVVPLGNRQSTDPTGPDAYGYYAYDNTDINYEHSRSFSYVPITGSGLNLNLNDPGEQQPGATTYSTVRSLPFPFMFYGVEYGQITICSNGWAAFGDQHELDMFRNYPIPGQQAPDAMIAPFWDDLATSGSGRGVWEYYDAANHRYIVQWKAVGAFQSSLQDFEIILLDPEHYPTTDGNGIIIVQYQQVTEMIGGSHDVHYSTVGIQAPGGLVGLSYRFNNAAAPGAASLSSGRCVVYTTEGRSAFGTITGTVTDAATELPVVGAILTLDGEAYSDTTDAQGTYSLSSVMIGTYTMRARAIGYNEGIVTNLVIEQDSVQEVNFAMLHPEIEVSVEHIDIRLPNDPPEAFFEIINNGNGALDYEIHVAYAPQRGPDDWWTYLDGFDATAATGDVMIQGCELAGDYWWVTGTGTEGVPKLYRFDLDGNFVDALPQPAGNEYGWMDMAFDGTYLYGSSGPAIIGVDLTGVVRDTIPTPLDPARAIAHDPQTDHFWVADYASDIFEINRHGETIRRFPATHRTTGLAWNPADPIGYDLYVFGHTITSEFALVSRFHPQNGDGQLVVTLNREPGDRAGGCTVTPRWNSTLLVFGGIMQNSSSDRLAIWELDFNTTWIAITPMFGSVLGGTSREIEIAFDAGALRDDVYRVDLTLTNNTASGPITLPVSLTVALPAGEPQPAPVTYALYQNQPNPFNATTTIRYDLAQPGWVRLQVFNVLGQEVSVPISEFHAAGSHQVQLQMNDLPSGLYLYRIESGSFHQTRKLMLLK